MKFKSGTRRRAIEYEKDLVQYWKKNKTFEKSVEGRPEDNRYGSNWLAMGGHY
jgi:hypothetical protein